MLLTMLAVVADREDAWDDDEDVVDTEVDFIGTESVDEARDSVL